jgi:hypothetical protein
VAPEKPRAGSRRKVFLQSALWAVALFSLAGALALAQEAPPQPTPAPAVQEVIQAVVEAPQSLPVPDPTPELAPTPAPSKTPDSAAAGSTFPESPALNPVAPLRAADVQFPTPPGAPTNEPLVMIGRPVAKTDYGSGGNLRASQLRSMPPESFTFDRSALRDVFRLLAEEAGIPYIGIPEHSPKAQRLVTFKMTASPFAALESLARQNDIQLTFEDGVWFMRIRDSNLDRVRAAEKENELIGVVYQLKYDPVDVVDFKGSGGSIGGGGGGAAAGATSATTPQLPLQNSQRVFEAKAPRIVNEIRVMLGMKPLDYGDAGEVTDPETTAGTEGQSAGIPPFDGVVGEAVGGEANAATVQSFFPVYIPPQKPQVIYNSDTNILWVVATRKQHKWVADYLSRVDKPQDLIAIEVKFFETNKNPQTDFGINWENTLGGDGLTFNATARAEPAGVIQNGSATFSAPYSAVLTMNQASVAIQAFARDREGSFVQYPRVLTINNREVAITSAENTPVNSGVQNVSSGSVGGQNVGSLSYVPTGTQINILPKAVGKNAIALTVAITISSIIDFVPINLGTGVSEYPRTTERVYNASLQVDSGYTLAVGGLEKSTDLRTTGGIPLLKDIPGVGYLFKNKGRDRNRSNLIIFITPYVIDDPSRTPGISETPESTLPVRPGVPPPAPNFAPDGQLVGGSGAVPGAFTWLEYQLKYFRQINKEARDDAKTIRDLRGVIQRARALSSDLQAQVLEGAGYAPMVLLDNSARADALLVELNKVLSAAQLDQFQLNQGLP